MTSVLQPAAAMRIAEDVWLSGLMERPVFRVDVGDGRSLEPGAAAVLKAHAAGRGAAMYYAKTDTSAVAAVRELGTAGMHVVDTTVTLERAAGEAPEPPDGVEVNDCPSDQADAVLDIAGSCFRYSRFHVDPQIPRPLAHRIKREWVASYVRGQRGERLLVATAGGRVAGFLAVLSAAEAGRQVRVIDLVGVDERSQRSGVGIALVAAFIERAGTADLLRVGTQVANLPSLALYHRCGFRIAGTGYVLHMHL